MMQPPSCGERIEEGVGKRKKARTAVRRSLSITDVQIRATTGLQFFEPLQAPSSLHPNLIRSLSIHYIGLTL